nr:integrase, catalytic region, zinc finger, CCHC-type, peptidase aspartic, catalytic [Tanacetum cinerariifolium]
MRGFKISKVAGVNRLRLCEGFVSCSYRGGQDNAINEDVDEQPIQDLALNVDNVFQDDGCDVFDSDVDEAPMVQTMLMANLSSAYPVNDEAEPSYDLDILSEYVKDSVVPVVHSNVSSIPNDAYMMIYNDMYEPHAQSVSKTLRNIVVEKSLTTELATYKEQVEQYERWASVSKDQVKPKFLAPGKYAIDVEPILPRLRNNREAHLDYLMHLKESVETIREIVEEAKVVRPLDSLIFSACRYIKNSHELLKYAIGTCLQDTHQRDKKLAPAPLIRKKQVTFAKPSNTSNSNTHKRVAKLDTQKTNVPVPPST